MSTASAYTWAWARTPYMFVRGYGGNPMKEVSLQERQHCYYWLLTGDKRGIWERKFYASRASS